MFSTQKYLFAVALLLFPDLAKPLVKPASPNIVIIMVDDMGYSDIGCYGGEIETPNLDKLAANGLRFTQFYNSGRCCPTRASLLTGLHPHQAGIGHMTNTPAKPKSHDRGVPGFRGFLNRKCVTIAEVLKPRGYHTLMSGKWHVGYHGKQKWPLQRGFDRYYGIIAGASNFFRPEGRRGLTLGNEPVKPEGNYYTTDAFTDYAIQFVEEANDRDDRPFFLYLAYTAPHWPLHARKRDIDKYRGRYMEGGWDKVSRDRYKRMLDMGLIRKEWGKAPRDARGWDELSKEKKVELDLRMAIYSAQVDSVDQNVGRLIASLKKMERLGNTIIFFLSDNGGCAEGGELGGGAKEDLESDRGFMLSYGRAWANASNTPFRRYKHHVHEGGMATPLIVHWPDGIAAKGEFRTQPAFLPDLMATTVAATGASYPKRYHGNNIPPMQGLSLLPAFANKSLGNRPLYWEHERNKAIRIGDWKLVTAGDNDWELYNLANDRAEVNNLAAAHPERVQIMADRWEAWARSAKVVPRDRSEK